MEDVTDYVFREMVTETVKPDVLFTEFTSVDALVSKGFDAVVNKLKYSEGQRPIVAQIWGADPNYFLASAKVVYELGFDGIDINMGCPDKNVVKRSSGAALIGNNALVQQIIQATRAGAPTIPLSVKTRLSTNPESTQEWISFLLSQDIKALTIHCRTAKAKSKGDAKWGELGKAVELKNKINPGIAIIGNGDVLSYGEILEKHREYGVDGVMIGRGIFKNPWVFEKSESPRDRSKEEYLQLLQKHARLFNATWGSSKNFEIMKKFFKVYVKEFRGADELRKTLMECRNHEDLESVLKTVGK